MGCPDENLILDLVAGAVTPGARAELEDHFDGCAECRALVASVVGDDDNGDTAPTRPAVDLRTLRETKRVLVGELDVDPDAFESIMRLIESQLDVSLSRMLDPARGGLPLDEDD